MKATRAPATEGAMLYHSMLIHFSTCPTSFHHLYSMMKLAMVLVKASRMSANSTASRIRLRICERRINRNGQPLRLPSPLSRNFHFGFPRRWHYTKERPRTSDFNSIFAQTIGQPPSRVKLSWKTDFTSNNGPNWELASGANRRSESQPKSAPSKRRRFHFDI